MISNDHRINLRGVWLGLSTRSSTCCQCGGAIVTPPRWRVSRARERRLYAASKHGVTA